MKMPAIAGMVTAKGAEILLFIFADCLRVEGKVHFAVSRAFLSRFSSIYKFSLSTQMAFFLLIVITICFTLHTSKRTNRKSVYMARESRVHFLHDPFFS